MAALSTGALVVFLVVALALLAFVTEVVPPDVTALGVLVSLPLLEPWTGVTPEQAVAGFASPATLTILAMYVLSEAVQRTGLVDYLGVLMARWTRGDERRTLLATVAATTPLAGVVNNTPVVAVFIPMITDLAEDAHLSPSKLLLPLSYASMLGGTLTLVGTAGNVLASDIAVDLTAAGVMDHGPIGMFELTPVGLLVCAVGGAYLLTVGRRLVPERIEPTEDLVDVYELERYLGVAVVREDSPLVGMQVDERFGDLEQHVDVLQFERDGEVVVAAETDRALAAGDVLTLQGSRQERNRFTTEYDLRELPREVVEAEDLAAPWTASTLYEAVVPSDSTFVGRSPLDIGFRTRFDTTVIAIRRGNDVRHEALRGTELTAGDTLLMHASDGAADHLQDRGSLLVTRGLFADAFARDLPDLHPKTPLALLALGGAVLAAALTALPIYLTALAGCLLAFATRTIDPATGYDAVSWNVVFLLAGVLPLATALEATGGAAWIAETVGATIGGLPAVAVVAAFYLLTGVLANVVTPVASIVLLGPIAARTAVDLGHDPFAALLAVTFAGSTAFMTPIGYQTNLMVYGPGGYKFTDYARVGAPLQALLAVVTTFGIAAWFGV
ncbi:SLC13 family permease [Halorubellus sp. PRR65]|uniref:SLC13 family permease n=1 Tax=Halorubellus sp. PRR65 TaxID=3098148 RepID=UPI002B26077A|nr:SLC13 family permease [Halorubellus sp. PRR65]